MNMPPVPPPQTPMVQKNGNIHPGWHNYFTQLTTLLQQNLSNEGYIVPGVTSAQLAVLNNAQSMQRIIFDSDAGVMKINNAGVFQQIATI